MTIASKYNVEVSWRTLAKDVFQLTRETVDNPATYRMTVKAIDSNDPGAGLKEIGYTLFDFIGIPYSIIGTTSTTIDVSDDFRTGKCPTSGKNAFICKSVFKGRALYISQIHFQHLHPLALNNSRKYDISLLWANDPNAKKVPFTSSEQPAIENYQTDQVDPEDSEKTINYAELYGDDPNIRCIITISSTFKQAQQLMPQFDIIDNKLVRVWFDLGGNPSTGYLIISKS